MVAFESVDAPLALPILLAGVLCAGAIGFVLVIVLGDVYLEAVGQVAYWKLSTAVLALLIALSALFAGPIGVVVFVAATAIGMVPVRFRARRVHLMGVLMGPLIFAG